MHFIRLHASESTHFFSELGFHCIDILSSWEWNYILLCVLYCYVHLPLSIHDRYIFFLIFWMTLSIIFKIRLYVQNRNEIAQRKSSGFQSTLLYNNVLERDSSSFNQKQRKMTKKKKKISYLINRCLSVKYLAENLSKY